MCFILNFYFLQFFMLLPPLHDLVVEIEHDDIRGGQLLNLLYKRCHCGVPELQVCLQRYQIRLFPISMHILYFIINLLYPLSIVQKELKWLKILDTHTAV